MGRKKIYSGNKKQRQKHAKEKYKSKWYKDGNFVINKQTGEIRHRYWYKNKVLSQMDKLAKNMTINDLDALLEIRNHKVNSDMIDKKKSENLTNEEVSELWKDFRKQQSVLRDWMDKKIAEQDLEYSEFRVDDFTQGVILNEGNVTTYEYNEDETEIIVRDGEGNIIDRVKNPND